MLLSNDIEGFGAVPQWSLNADRNGLTLSLGGPGGRRFDATLKAEASAIRAVPDGLEFDATLRSKEDAPGEIRVSGHVACPKYGNRNEVPEPVVDLLGRVSGATVRRYASIDFGRAKHPMAISAVVPKARAEALLETIRPLLPRGWIAFIGSSFVLETERSVELVVGPGRDQFDILRIARTDAVNFDMTTEGIVKELRDYHRLAPIDILRAETDTVEFRFESVPRDVAALAERIDDFCPGALSQGIGSVEALEEHLLEEKRVLLWWD